MPRVNWVFPLPHNKILALEKCKVYGYIKALIWVNKLIGILL